MCECCGHPYMWINIIKPLVLDVLKTYGYDSGRRIDSSFKALRKNQLFRGNKSYRDIYSKYRLIIIRSDLCKRTRTSIINEEPLSMWPLFHTFIRSNFLHSSHTLNINIELKQCFGEDGNKINSFSNSL